MSDAQSPAKSAGLFAALSSARKASDSSFQVSETLETPAKRL
jgi:hypothetical protein